MTIDSKAMSRQSAATPTLPFAGKRLHDYSKKRTRRLSLFTTHAPAPSHNSHQHHGLCASLTDWNVDQLRQRCETNGFKLSLQEQIDVTFRVRRHRMEQHVSKMQQQQDYGCTKKSSNQKKTCSKRQDLAIVRSQETGAPRALPETLAAASDVPNHRAGRIQRRASMGANIVTTKVDAVCTTSYTAAALCSPVPLRRHASLTELEDKLKQLPGHSPPRNKPVRKGTGAYTNQLTQQLEVTLLNADLPQDAKRRLMRRSSIGGGSLHSSSMDSSVHSTSVFGDDDDNIYGYGDDARPVQVEIEASQAMRRMRRSSVGGVMTESDICGHGDAAPNIRVLNPVSAPAVRHDVESTHSRRRMRRSSIGGPLESDPYGYGYGEITPQNRGATPSSPDFEAAQAMHRMRRCSIGGVIPSSGNGLKSHGHGDCPPNVRWITQSSDSMPLDMTVNAGNAFPLTKDDPVYCSPVRSFSSPLTGVMEDIKRGKKSKKKNAEDPSESLRGLEQLALDLAGQSTQLSPKRSPRRNVPAPAMGKAELGDGPAKHSPTKMLPTKRVALGA